MRTSVVSGAAPLLEMDSLVKTFKAPAGDVTVLKNISAQIGQGEFVSVIGKSGSGKSTLLNMITGIDHPTTGTVRVGDQYLHKLNEGQLSVWRGKTMGVVFQFFQLLPMLSLMENLLLPMDFARIYSPGERDARARELLEMVGLSEVADHFPASISGGQQQSAAIARALANNPPIIVADEPTGNLDSRAAEGIFALFERLAEQGKTILMVTHDAGLARRAQRVLVLVDGELVNESISRTLPNLPHREMLVISKAARRLEIHGGQELPPGSWALVQHGCLEVTLPGPGGSLNTVEKVESGGNLWLGELPEEAHVQACSAVVDLLLVEEAGKLLSQTPMLRAGLTRERAERQARYAAAAKGPRKGWF
jgi:putative ABC transport system ATP-binding protein